MSFFWLLWVACEQPVVTRNPTWTAEESLRPTWEVLDSNHDGAVSGTEWGPVSYGGPEFQTLDSDGSGGLDLVEFLAVVRGIDPDGFDGKRMKLKPNAGQVAASGPVPREVRHVGNALALLAEEIKGATGVGPLPAKEDVRAASRTMSLSSAESRAVLTQLREAWRAAGRTFPEELSLILDQPTSQ